MKDAATIRDRGLNPAVELRSHRLSAVLLVMFCLPRFDVSLLGVQSESAPNFESHILPLFRKSCLGCHDSETRTGGLSLETREAVLEGGESGPVVVMGKPVESLLLSLVSSGKMPAVGSQLSEDEIGLIQRWIETGADSEDVAAVTEHEIMDTIIGPKCFVCHGRRQQQAGLDLRTRANLLAGGKSGPAIVPGKPDESLMVRRIVAQEMPPPKLQEQYSVRGLTSDELARLRHWIEAGAPENDEASASEVIPESDPIVRAADREHWSFQPPRRPPVPTVDNDERAENAIDAFLLEKLEQKELRFSVEADRSTLMRRLYFDLVGLPPSPEEIDEYLLDDRPRAYERLVDRLLESRHHGERWARYWLDAAGYSDSEGGVSADNTRPYTYQYRDYVIRSLNADKPYDRFLVEQIAGDELSDYKAAVEFTKEQIDQLVATGFLRLGPDSTYSTEQNLVPERFDVVATEIEILSSAVLGLTMGCARCHDHKYDPLPQRDYYRMSAILQTAFDPYDWLSPNLRCIGVGANCDDDNTRYLPLRSTVAQRRVEEHNAPIQREIDELKRLLDELAVPYRDKLVARKLEQLPEDVREDMRVALATPAQGRSELQRYLAQNFGPKLEVTLKEISRTFEEFRKPATELDKRIEAEKQKLEPEPRIRALFDMGGTPTSNRLLHRGEPGNPGPLVRPGVPSVLATGLSPYRIEKPSYSTETSGRRLALARWLTQANHPLTARVMVNRIWQHHFGTALVSTPGNFGSLGARPTHPRLLDWLATEFVRAGWSIKAMHRLMVTSAAYRQSSQATAQARRIDPGNVLLSRFPLRRLDADALRDALLKVADRLDTTPFGPADELEVSPEGEVVGKVARNGYRRSIYLLQRRSKPVTMLETFDAPFLTPNCVKRAHSTVSSQALQLMNAHLIRENAHHMAGRIIEVTGGNPEKQIERLYRTTFGRSPSKKELRDAESSLRAMTAEWKERLELKPPAEPIPMKAGWLALASLSHTFLNAAEFLYVD